MLDFCLGSFTSWFAMRYQHIDDRIIKCTEHREWNFIEFNTHRGKILKSLRHIKIGVYTILYGLCRV